jgi:outer membrane protein TolC
MEVFQPLFDGGMTRALKQSETASSKASIQALEVGLTAYKRQVAQLFFQLLSINDQRLILQQTLELMTDRMHQVEAALNQGVAQKNDLLKVKSETLILTQRLDELKAAEQSGREILGLLTGVQLDARTLIMPEAQGDLDYSVDHNPEIQLINTRQNSILAKEGLLTSQRMPKVSAFGQVGLGAPNPFNFFNADLSTYYIAGIRASWTLWDWNKTALERKNLQLNHHMLDEQRNQKTLEVNSNVARLRSQTETLIKALERDEEIKSMRTEIRINAAVQLDQGIIATPEYLEEVLAEQKAVIQVSVDNIALRQNQIMLQFETGGIQ